MCQTHLKTRFLKETGFLSLEIVVRLKTAIIPLLRIEATRNLKQSRPDGYTQVSINSTSTNRSDLGQIAVDKIAKLFKFPLIPLLRIEATEYQALNKTLVESRLFPLIPLLRIEATRWQPDERTYRDSFH